MEISEHFAVIEADIVRLIENTQKLDEHVVHANEFAACTTLKEAIETVRNDSQAVHTAFTDVIKAFDSRLDNHVPVEPKEADDGDNGRG